jgi:hypothetical protein
MDGILFASSLRKSETLTESGHDFQLSASLLRHSVWNLILMSTMRLAVSSGSRPLDNSSSINIEILNLLATVFQSSSCGPLLK